MQETQYLNIGKRKKINFLQYVCLKPPNLKFMPKYLLYQISPLADFTLHYTKVVRSKIYSSKSANYRFYSLHPSIMYSLSNDILESQGHKSLIKQKPRPYW